MDIYCLPSTGTESFGNSVVEAMHMGLPSIVFRDGGGLTEHIEDGSSGFIVGSIQELSDRIRQLIENLPLRKRLGEAGKQAVHEKYALEAMIARYDNLYRTALLRNLKR